MKQLPVQMRSASQVNHLDTDNTEFKHSIKLELHLNKSKEIVRAVLARFGQDIKTVIGLQHITWSDGSESDLWGHYGVYGQERLLIKITHHWIDPHFLIFIFDEIVDKKTNKPPIDMLFPEIVLNEAHRGKSKFGELLVTPCNVEISTILNDPIGYIPDKILEAKTETKIENLSINFWNKFNTEQYESAIVCVNKLSSFWDSKNSQRVFLKALEAICYFKADQNQKSVKIFIAACNDFASIGIQSYCDLCTFFAIDAAKGITETGVSVNTMKQIAEQIPDLLDSQKEEIAGILNNYATKVYIGVAVLCRRLVEVTLKEKLHRQFNKSIIELVKECNNAGELNGRPSTGLYPVLIVAKWKGILTSDQFKIAKGIKGYGDLIHDENEHVNESDAKITLEACIRIIRQLNVK